MKQVLDIKLLSGELRLRLKEDLIEPLMFLETIAKAESQSIAVIERVFSDFRKANDRIWLDLDKQLVMLKQENGRLSKTQTRRRIC